MVLNVWGTDASLIIPTHRMYVKRPKSSLLTLGEFRPPKTLKPSQESRTEYADEWRPNLTGFYPLTVRDLACQAFHSFQWL